MKKSSNKLKSIIRIYPYLFSKDRHIRLMLLTSIIFLLVTIALNISVPLILKKAIDLVGALENTSILLFVLYGFAWTVGRLTNHLRLIFVSRVIERGKRNLFKSIFKHLISLSFRFHSVRNLGGILNTVERSQFAFWPFFCGLFFLILPTVIEILVAAGILIYLYGFNYGATLLIVLFSYITFSYVGSKWSVKKQQVANKSSSSVSARFVESILNYENISYFNRSKQECDMFDSMLSNRENNAVKQHLTSESIHLGQGLIMGTGLLSLTILTGQQVIYGNMKISDFILVNMYLLQFISPLGNLGFILRDMSEGLTNFLELDNIFDINPEITDKVDTLPLQYYHGEIHFNSVYFSYDSNKVILNDVTFTARSNKITAIVGPTGSGKSTIAKLLFRAYDICDGNITIDNQDIRQVKLSSLREKIGIIPQNPTLFMDTIYNNISYGNPEATYEEVLDIVKTVHLDKLIESLADGLNTIVGENGVKLSGGEKQRIAIARVLLCDFKLVVFDEATSSLDAKTEYLIQQNINKYLHGRTAIIIAHRLSTVMHADNIIVIDNGHVIQKGTHNTLINIDGYYKNLYLKQLSEASNTNLED